MFNQIFYGYERLDSGAASPGRRGELSDARDPQDGQVLRAEIPTLRVDKWHKAPVMLNGVRGRWVRTIHYHGYSGKKACKGNT